MKDNYSKSLKHLHLPQYYFVTCKYTVVVPYNYTFVFFLYRPRRFKTHQPSLQKVTSSRRSSRSADGAWLSALLQHKGNEEASLRQESRERILNTISRDIWAPAVLIKGFSLLTLLLGGFCEQCNRSRMEKLEKDTRVSPVYTPCFLFCVFFYRLQHLNC